MYSPSALRPRSPALFTIAIPRKLTTAPSVSLQDRVLHGFLAREGCWTGEAVALSWRDIDLHHGVLTLDKNQAGDARAWALDPGVVRALRALRERHCQAADDTDRVFLDEHGRPYDSDTLAKRLRRHLKAARVGRLQLYSTTAQRGRVRAHDLRGTFVTLSHAQGRSETWVADRTGHTSSQMINRYRRAARSAQELKLGLVTALDRAIAELRPVSRKAVIETWRGWRGRRGTCKPRRSLARPAGFEPATSGLERGTNQHRNSGFRNSSTRLDARSCEERRVLGNHCPNPEPMGKHCPNPGAVDDVRVGTVRGLANALVKALEGGDLRGAVGGSKALVAYVDTLFAVSDRNGENDNGMRAGLASARPAPAPVFPALRLCA